MPGDVEVEGEMVAKSVIGKVSLQIFQESQCIGVPLHERVCCWAILQCKHVCSALFGIIC